MHLSPNFVRAEFEQRGTIPIDAIPSYASLCRLILEPIRSRFDHNPIIITSGYRPALINARVGGSPASQHTATNDYCAADWYIAKYAMDMRPVFDWIREKSNLTWDQLILEHGRYNDVIHTSWSRFPRLQAMEGETQNRSSYTAFDVSSDRSGTET